MTFSFRDSAYTSLSARQFMNAPSSRKSSIFL
jgi:hypothetical protein